LLIDRAGIAARVPHSGAMCLLDSVLHWDATSICCSSGSHRDPDNPLRNAGRLHAICGAEYAAQAMALHGALTRAVGERPQAGYLARVRELVCRAERLDGLEGDLIIEAKQLLADGQRVIYQFTIRCGAAELLSGRAAVVLDASSKN
jgi:predicted hotdog family 3-hydroxylacyl-ACP dehydratase